MGENDIFRDALKNFVYAAGSGGAIAHLADLGYTPQEIEKMLDFPTPYRQVQETFWDHLLEKKMIVCDTSELGKRKEKVRFVTDYNSYGRKSFRRVVEYEEGEDLESDPDAFPEVTYNPGTDGAFASFLGRVCGEDAYVSCDFALRQEAFFEPLTEKQRLYMKGVLWRRKPVWHRLDPGMTEILVTLYEKSSYHGTILLLDKKEKILF